MSNFKLEIKLESPGAPLSQEQREVVEDNFKLLDRDKDGKLSIKEVGILFRAFGQNPTDEELAELLKPVPAAGLDVEGFCDFFRKSYKVPTSEEALVQAFQVFDLEGTGVISVEKFKEMLCSLGEPMPPDEVDKIMAEVEVDFAGQFSYKSLAKKLCDGPVRIPDLP
uniref:Calmodulin n=1 Tax=Zooxanthella nutricula TaxID=1333877 RepID=A0A6V0FMX7_9DINO|mmetsp:Transcript_85523/g.261545  ORF Transcript_85523/g.261545 Transcript_85523/m.261545 type:complete len:167 (-) Transcript_85523:21-521(-)